MKTSYILLCMAIMSLVTYIIRVTPMIIFRKKITNLWVRSFLQYVPYVVLSAMTVPAVFNSTGSGISAVTGFVVALALSYFKKGLLTVAICATLAAFIVQIIQ